MPYTTPARFCTDLGYQEVANLLLDDGSVLTGPLLSQVVAVVAGTGAWAPETTSAERVVAMAAHDQLVRKLNNVSNLMDGYLRTGGVTLPLQDGGQNAGTLEDCCVALLREELAEDQGTSSELVISRAAIKRKWLVDISRKTVTLVGQDGQDAASTGGVRTGQANSGYNWAAHSQGFGGYRS